ncbi:MAG TPA: immunoglobulin domain-containing protein [Anaerohalosphaeraceae bacterium]|nr:immunoglobulin domain-containing protein [Anaerohalosphaeraceae bacterium]HPP56188.1 immunoglobulin domain-containing protein [Anaerohalosphaeraceae bacterium]
MKQIKTQSVLILFLLVGWPVCGASLFDNFEIYPTGALPSPWVITGGSPVVAQESGGNRYMESYGSYRGLGGLAVPAADTETTFFFRLYKPAGTEPDCSVGLSYLAAPTGDWNDFECYVVVVGGELRARNGTVNTAILNPFSAGVWYNIWLVINNLNNTYDVYVTTGQNAATAADRRADDFVFRNSISGPLQSFKVYGRGTGYGPVRVDDIYLSAGTNLTLPYLNTGLPVLLTNPNSVQVREGQPAVFETTFTSETAPVVQWFKKGPQQDEPVGASLPNVNIELFANGQTYNSRLTLNPAAFSDAGLYYCRISNGSGFSVNSTSARLIVEGLLAHWTLDVSDYVGGVYADAVSGYTAAVTGVPVFVEGADGRSLGAVQIDADSGWAVTEPLDLTGGTGAMTVSLWAQRLSGMSLGSDIQMESWPEETLLSVEDGLSSEGRWQHICVVYTGTSARVYVDGVFRTEGAYGLPMDTTAQLTLGGGIGGVEIFEGRLDDVRIYNYAFSSEEVAQVYYEMTGMGVCLLGHTSEYDLTGPAGAPDCVVDLYDLAAFASLWLEMYTLPDLADLAAQWEKTYFYPN